MKNFAAGFIALASAVYSVTAQEQWDYLDQTTGLWASWSDDDLNFCGAHSSGSSAIYRQSPIDIDRTLKATSDGELRIWAPRNRPTKATMFVSDKTIRFTPWVTDQLKEDAKLFANTTKTTSANSEHEFSFESLELHYGGPAGGPHRIKDGNSLDQTVMEAHFKYRRTDGDGTAAEQFAVVAIPFKKVEKASKVTSKVTFVGDIARILEKRSEAIDALRKTDATSVTTNRRVGYIGSPYTAPIHDAKFVGEVMSLDRVLDQLTNQLKQQHQDNNNVKKETKPNMVRYNGSLMHPPCTQNVNWYVATDVAVVSAADLRPFKNIFGQVEVSPSPPGPKTMVEKTNVRTVQSSRTASATWNWQMQEKKMTQVSWKNENSAARGSVSAIVAAIVVLSALWSGN